jgi:hypothetical protein
MKRIMFRASLLMMILRFRIAFCFLLALIPLSLNNVCLSLDEHFVGVWLFDEGSGRTASDSSRYGNHGRIEGGAEWVDGKSGKALSFNGIGAYVEVPSSDSLKVADAITIEFWLFPRSMVDNTQASWSIVRKHTQPPFPSYDYEVLAGKAGTGFNIGFSVNPTDIVIGGENVPFNQWTHLAFTYDGKKVLVYINGEPRFEQDNPGTIPTSDSPLYIGCRDTTRRFIDAILDELCLSDIARAVDEIKAHIENGVADVPHNVTAVSIPGKLATTWGQVRSQ